jgi:hypothetical protein
MAATDNEDSHRVIKESEGKKRKNLKEKTIYWRKKFD